MGRLTKSLVNLSTAVIYGSIAAMFAKVAWDTCDGEELVKRARKKRAQKYAEVRPEEGSDED